MEFNDNGKRKVYNIDLDGTLTNGEPFWKQEPTINPAMLEKIIELYKSGNIIIIWTARQWQYAPETVGWLIKNRVPYHGIQMGKGGADCYIDDKNVLIGDMLISPPPHIKIEMAPGTIKDQTNFYADAFPGCWILRSEIVARDSCVGATVSVGGKLLTVSSIRGDLILLNDMLP